MSNELEGLVATSESLQLQHEAESHRGIFGLVGADLYAADESGIELRAVTDGALVSTIPSKSGTAGFAASPDGQRIATWGFDDVVRLFDRQGRELARHESGTQHGSLGWTGDGSALLFTSEREPVRAFSRDGAVLAPIPARDRSLSWELQPAGAMQALGHDGQRAWLFDVATGTGTAVFEHFGESIGRVAAHGDALAFATRGGVVLRLASAPPQKALDALRKDDHAFALKVMTRRQAVAKRKVNRDSIGEDLKELRARIKAPTPKLEPALRLWSAGGWTDDVALLDERSVLATTPSQVLLLEAGADGARQTRLVTMTARAGALASVARVFARGSTIAVMFAVVGGMRTRFYRLSEGRQSLGLSDFEGASAPAKKVAKAKPAKPAKKPSKKK